MIIKVFLYIILRLQFHKNLLILLIMNIMLKLVVMFLKLQMIQNILILFFLEKTHNQKVECI